MFDWLLSVSSLFLRLLILRRKVEAMLMRSDDYYERLEYILELEALGELGNDEKEKRMAELLEEICRILESPLHLQTLQPAEEERLISLRREIIKSTS